MSLETLIPQYGENKKQQDYFKKLCDEQNKQIKQIMSETGEDVFEAGGYKATYSVSQRESFNEDKLIELLKKHKVRAVVKKKEYVDMDALEKSIYAGKLSKDVLAELDSCKIYKEVETLRVTKTKKS